MRDKLIGGAIAAVLASMATVGAFASQDGSSVGVLDVTETPVATETPIEGATGTPEATATPEDATETPEPTGTPDVTETPEATATTAPDETPTPDETSTPDATTTSEPAPTATPEEDDGEGEREYRGIPESNPVFTDDDGDGVCEKHETKLKERPSGVIVRVPCHAGNPHADDGDDAGEGDESGAAEAGNGAKPKKSKRNGHQ